MMSRARASDCRTVKMVAPGPAPIATNDFERPEKADDAPRPLRPLPDARKMSGPFVNYIEEQQVVGTK